MQTTAELNKDVIVAIQNLADAIVEVFDRLVELIRTICNEFWQVLMEFLKKANPRLFNLAYNHKKARTRKKNIARLFKWLKSFKN